MRIVRHIDYVNAQKRRSKIAAGLGFLVLSSSMFIAMYPRMLLFAYIAMVVGFIAFNIGMQGVGKWTRKNRNDEIIDFRLKHLNDRYTTVHYAKVGDRIIDHMLVHPGGILVMAGKEIDGKVVQNGMSWRRSGGLFRRVFQFSGPQLGNPSVENDRSLETLDTWLTANGHSVETLGATVFLDPRVRLQVEDPDYPVLMGEELPAFIHDLPTDPDFSQTEREEIERSLAADAEIVTPEKSTVSRRPRPVKRVAAPKTVTKTARNTEPQPMEEPAFMRKLRAARSSKS